MFEKQQRQKCGHDSNSDNAVRRLWSAAMWYCRRRHENHQLRDLRVEDTSPVRVFENQILTDVDSLRKQLAQIELDATKVFNKAEVKKSVVPNAIKHEVDEEVDDELKKLQSVKTESAK